MAEMIANDFYFGPEDAPATGALVDAAACRLRCGRSPLMFPEQSVRKFIYSWGWCPSVGDRASPRLVLKNRLEGNRPPQRLRLGSSPLCGSVGGISPNRREGSLRRLTSPFPWTGRA